MPVHAKAAVEIAIKSAPVFVDRVDMSSQHPRPAAASYATGNVCSFVSTMLPSHHVAGETISLPIAGSPILPQPFGPPSLKVTSGVESCPSNIPTCENEHYVYLCVDAGSRLFIDLDCNGVQTDAQFFAKIKSEYDEARGWFRLWFSAWRYDHCDFFKFQKTSIGLGARVRVGLPEPTDTMYHYRPRPALEMPPDGSITHEEFRRRYYDRESPSIFELDRWRRRPIDLSAIRTEALQAVPKRILKLDLQDGERKYFYGLYAKEIRSNWRVALHVVLCNTPGVIFFFLWLYQWGHGSDLQGAAVPAQLSLSLTLGYLGLMYWTR
jgi:hypothetical protein